MAGVVFTCFCRMLVLSLVSLPIIWAVEQVVIVHAPEAVKFLSSEPVHSSHLGDIMAALLGFTTNSKIKWKSLAVVEPWKRPAALAVLQIDGFGNGIDLPLEGNNFLLENAGDIDNQYQKLSFWISERFFEKRPVLLHMELGKQLHDSKIAQPLLLKLLPADPSQRLKLALADLELGEMVKKSTFNTSFPSDVQLLTELATVKELLKSLNFHKSELSDEVPDLFWLKIGGLRPVIDTYGANSFQFTEALRLLRQMISEVKNTIRKIYSDDAVMFVIKENEMSPSLGFKNRKLLETTSTAAPPSQNPYNLAAKWDPLFPVIFSMIAIISILMALSVIAVSTAMWNMDPGRDSIIYRMTSQRMKKD